MYKASRVLEHITPQQLDNYLENGWFRMDQRIFTEQYLQERLVFRDAVWLRQRLSHFVFPHWYLKMKRTMPFTVDVLDANPWPAHELLYQQYLQSKPQGFPQSLESILYGHSFFNIFPTRMMNVYKGNTLIASGFFDMGDRAAAGIVNYFHPDYKKYRFGKFLYLLAIETSMNEGKEFFYPGYFVPGNPGFNYKLEFHQPSLEFYRPASQRWEPFLNYHESDLPLTVMRKQITGLAEALENEDISCCLVSNVTYCLTATSRWDVPLVAIVLPSATHARQFAVSYDPNTERFYIFDAAHLDVESSIVEEQDMLICLQIPIRKSPVGEAPDAAGVIDEIFRLNTVNERQGPPET